MLQQLNDDGPWQTARTVAMQTDDCMHAVSHAHSNSDTTLRKGARGWAKRGVLSIALAEAEWHGMPYKDSIRHLYTILVNRPVAVV